MTATASHPDQQPDLARLASELEGEFHTGDLMRRIYATDASAYQETPLAVAFPANDSDIQTLVRFANEHHIGLIPRTAGTSLAGQVVGHGIVVDVSRTFTKIVEINEDEGWVRVQPGVVRNELNMALQPHGLLFGPETSTQNRAMVGGMLGNNSCGSNSIRYGSVRDHVLEVSAILSDGSKATFSPLTNDEFMAKCEGPDSLETALYRQAREALTLPANRDEIRKQFPKASIHRRNTGYALDKLMMTNCFDPSCDQPFHFGNLIAGSEGTLCLVTEMKLHCDRLPPPVMGLQCGHFQTIDEALRATQIAVRYDCYACELIDKYILDCTKRSLEHRENRFFLEGDPGAVLVTEIRGESKDEILAVTARLEQELKDAGLGYAFPVLFGADSVKIWNLRKAGLGLLSNIPGDDKPAPVIEDTAVDVDDLPDYIAAFNEQVIALGLECVHYGHAGSGELHLRPILNLKTEHGNRMFREVAERVATLVKQYGGSLSGEHGDGRLRGEFLQQMIGENNYQLIRDFKATWDPNNIFNPGKIVDTPPMDTQLRYKPGQQTKTFTTYFDWSATQGIVRAAEMCNGSGDCRKTHLTGGVMCPSYMATRNEKDTTRARANTLRQILTQSEQENPFNNEELNEVLDLCLSCKGCKKECPSTVDMAKLKAEFQQHYFDANGVPRRTKMIADFVAGQRRAAKMRWLWNFAFSKRWLRGLLNRTVGFHPKRSIPLLPPQTFESWFRSRRRRKAEDTIGEVLFFADEFTNFHDVEVGKKAVELLEHLGYHIELPRHTESGRTWLSKGLLNEAAELINENIRLLADRVSEDIILVGVEPSALLTYRDESLDLAQPALRDAAKHLAKHCLLLDEFIARETSAGRITSDSFTDESKSVLVHGHCFQKALTGVGATVQALRLPRNYTVKTIPSGCCGMAGSFGYEREHYELSMQIGELVLLPAVREAEEQTIICAAGTSCRHQVKDGTPRVALHPAEILRAALK